METPDRKDERPALLEFSAARLDDLFNGISGLLGPVSIDALQRWPVYIFRFEWLKLRQMYRSLRGPALTIVWTNVFWIVPIAVYGQYAQVYAMSQGLSEVQVGYLGSIFMVTNIVAYLLGGWLTDRLGCLRTVMLFDALSWPLQMALLAGADRPWHFYAASFLFGLMGAVIPAWHMLFVSRIPPERRAAAYGMLTVTNLVPSMLFPLAGGWLVGRWGLELSMRVIYFAAAVLMSAGVALRWTIMAPTPPRREAGPGFLRSLGEQFRIYARVSLRPGMRGFMLALALMNIFLPVANYFVPVYCMKFLRLPEAQFSLVSAAGGLVQLITAVALVPLITPKNTRRFFLAVAATLCAWALTYLALLHRPDPPVPLMPTLLTAVVLGSVGSALWGPAVLSQWANIIPEDIRTRLWGAHGAFNGLLAAAGLAAVGHLYKLWCPSLMVVFLVLLAGAGVCFAVSPVGTSGMQKEE